MLTKPCGKERRLHLQPFLKCDCDSVWNICNMRVGETIWIRGLHIRACGYSREAISELRQQKLMTTDTGLITKCTHTPMRLFIHRLRLSSVLFLSNKKQTMWPAGWLTWIVTSQPQQPQQCPPTNSGGFGPIVYIYARIDRGRCVYEIQNGTASLPSVLFTLPIWFVLQM